MGFWMGGVCIDMLHTLVDGSRQHVELLLSCELNEVDGIAADADCELRVFLGMLHGIEQQIAAEHVDIDVLSARWREVAVEQVHEVVGLHGGSLAECRWCYGEGV